MTTPVARFILLAVLVIIVAGCGSKGTNPGTANEPTGGGGVNGISVGNCLNEDENFLVQPETNALDGQSPGGVTFTLTFYKDSDAAKAVAAKKSAKFTAVVENGVVDFRGNPTIYEGAPPAKISQVELKAIQRCIDKAKSG
jgi:hypothetical protein